MFRVSLASMMILALAVPRAHADEPPSPDPLELRLDATGLSDADLARTTPGEGRIHDAELIVSSRPSGLSLLATRRLELGSGVERRLCRAPCTTYLEHGSYDFSVVRGRHRHLRDPNTHSIFADGTLELRIISRFWIRFGWYSFSAALIGSGLTLYLTHRTPERSDDPFCATNCVSYTNGQKVVMSIGGVMTMFGGISLRYAIGTRDVGHVEYHAARPNRHIDPDE